MNLEKVQKKLMIAFCASIAVCALLVVLYETDILPIGIYTESKSSEFVWTVIMELLTLCVIPLALKLFKFKQIHTQLIERKAQALLPWGLARLGLLAIPMLLNTLLYYLYMNVAFGYMGIILFLCLFFIIPTMDRCQSDVKE